MTFFEKKKWAFLSKVDENVFEYLIYEMLFARQDKACYEVKNLEIGCQYFIQVQAVAVYGGRRLASQKASKVFNSTDYNKYGRVLTQCPGWGLAGRPEFHANTKSWYSFQLSI